MLVPRGARLPSLPVLALAACLAGAAGRAAHAADLVPPLPPEARAHYDAAMDHYRAKRYDAAVRELEAAYALEPRREILFTQAQATRLLGDCPAALALYERFLATSPPARQVEATRLAIARCTEDVATPPVPPGNGAAAPGPTATPTNASTLPPAATLASAGAPKPVPAVVIAPPAQPPARRWYRDPAGGALAAAALVSAGLGVGLLRSAQAENRAGVDSKMLGGYDDHRGPAETRERWGLGSVIAGGALAACALGRYLWVGLGPGGRGLSAEGRF